MTKREQILVALFELLQTVPDRTLERNTPLGTRESGRFVRLGDGEIELIEEFFNPELYEFTMTPKLMIVVERGDAANRDAALDAELELFDAKLKTITDLGGLITAIRIQPADFAPMELFGTEDIKGAEVPIEIDFWSNNSLG